MELKGTEPPKTRPCFTRPISASSPVGRRASAGTHTNAKAPGTVLPNHLDRFFDGASRDRHHRTANRPGSRRAWRREKPGMRQVTGFFQAAADGDRPRFGGTEKTARLLLRQKLVSCCHGPGSFVLLEQLWLAAPIADPIGGVADQDIHPKIVRVDIIRRVGRDIAPGIQPRP